jgi:predicted DNA-binding transcriptional regulator AlpA
MTDATATLLRVDQVAEILGISRASAYRGVWAYFDTNGQRGIPAVRLAGRRIAIPAAAFQNWLETTRPITPDAA